MTDVKVQIYTMQSVEEAHAVAGLGVDHLGVTPTTRPLPGAISVQEAARICASLKGVATSVALSVESEVDRIVEMARTVRPDVVHLCGPPGALPSEAIDAIRERLPGPSIMVAIAVTGPESVSEARRFARHADYLILDSVDPDIQGIGAAGTVHDWEVSARIVTEVDVPVVLAGGLSPSNVADAVARVRPWGVDSLTHTNRAHPGGGFRKDLEAVAAFVAAVRGAPAS